MAHSVAATAHDDYLSAQFAALPPLPAIEKLSPTVWRILGGNPGKFQLQGTNTYLLGTGTQRLLIDTAQGVPVWSDSLKSVLAAENCSVSQCLITHHHQDHIGGIPDLRRLSSNTTVHKHQSGGDDGMLEITDGQVFSVEGATLTAVHTPGHSKDHMCFILAEEDDAIFTGDNVLGHGTTIFEDLHAYMRSLNVMLELKPSMAYPAHGAVIGDAQKKLKDYMRHRQRREDQILFHLRKQRELMQGLGEESTNGAVTSFELVKKIYIDVDEKLHRAAEHGTVQVLEKLEREGITATEEVEGEGEGSGKKWYLTDRASL